MNNLMNKVCSECGGKIKPKLITQDFEREGIKIKVSGIKAWVCEACGDIYFQPGGADKIATAVNHLFNLAIIEGQHKGNLKVEVFKS